MQVIVSIMLFFGLIGPMSFVKHHAAWAREMAYVSPAAWLHSAFMLQFVDDKPDLVIAHYQEDLSWLRSYLPYFGRVYVYCKHLDSCYRGIEEDVISNKAQFTVEYLPNVGRESHTYLTHITRHYQHLAPRTVFTLGSLRYNWMRLLSLRYAIADTGAQHMCVAMPKKVIKDVYNFRIESLRVPMSLGDGYNTLEDVKPISLSSISPLGVWLDHYLSLDLSSQTKRCGYGIHGAIFSATKEMIGRYKLDQYKTLLSLNGLGDSLEVGYYLERSWRFILK